MQPRRRKRRLAGESKTRSSGRSEVYEGIGQSIRQAMDRQYAAEGTERWSRVLYVVASSERIWSSRCAIGADARRDCSRRHVAAAADRSLCILDKLQVVVELRTGWHGAAAG